MKRRRWVWIGGVGLGIFLAGPIALYLDKARQEAALREQYARARRLGMPDSPAGLGYPLDDPKRNAAITYERLFEKGFLARSRSLAAAGRDPTSPDELGAMRGEFRLLEGDLEAYERASRLPFCRFTHLFDTFDKEGLFRARLANVVKVLATRARVEAASGDPVKGTESLASAARISAHMGQATSFIGLFGRAGMEKTVDDALLDLLQRHGRDASVRAGARQVLVAFGPELNFKSAFLADWLQQMKYLPLERKGGVREWYEATEDLGWSKAERIAFALRIGMPGGHAEHEAYRVRFFLDTYEALPDDPPDVAGALRASKRLQAEVADTGIGAAYARSLFLPPDEGFLGMASIDVRRRLISRLLDHLDHPSAPEPAGTDPFSGRSYRSKVKGDSLILWSVGRNGKDEGGGGDDIRVASP